jgi:two-component system NarL family sensor kinase
MRAWKDVVRPKESSQGRSRPRPERPALSSNRAEVLEFPGRGLEGVICKVAEERNRAGKALRYLTGRLLQAQEEERRRLARELHDGLNQQLAMLAVELGILAREVPDDQARLRDQILNLRSRTEAVSNDVRSMTHHLHPAALEHLGLVSALRIHCTDFSRHEHVRVRFTAQGEVGRMPDDVALSLYRIAQEALRNVAKHSGAPEAWVNVSRRGHYLRLLVVDEGCGFVPSKTKKSLGLGLVSIKERVQLVHGFLSVKSAPEQGTRIEVDVPISWKESGNQYEYQKTASIAGR